MSMNTSVNRWVAAVGSGIFVIVAMTSACSQAQSGSQPQAKSAAAAPTDPGDFKIVSARRSDRWGPLQAKYHPPDPKDVVLWIQVAPTPEGWRDTKVPLYVQVGERRCDNI